jgi:hypothetical protein
MSSPSTRNRRRSRRGRAEGPSPADLRSGRLLLPHLAVDAVAGVGKCVQALESDRRATGVTVPEVLGVVVEPAERFLDPVEVPALLRREEGRLSHAPSPRCPGRPCGPCRRPGRSRATRGPPSPSGRRGRGNEGPSTLFQEALLYVLQLFLFQHRDRPGRKKPAGVGWVAPRSGIPDPTPGQHGKIPIPHRGVYCGGTMLNTIDASAAVRPAFPGKAPLSKRAGRTDPEPICVICWGEWLSTRPSSSTTTGWIPAMRRPASSSTPRSTRSFSGTAGRAGRHLEGGHHRVVRPRSGAAAVKWLPDRSTPSPMSTGPISSSAASSVLLDRERRSEANHLMVGLLGQDPPRHQRFAERSGRSGGLADHHSDHEPLAPHMVHMR